MDAPRGFLSRIKAAVKGLATKLRPRPSIPATIETPPSARPMWHDPAAHARDFAEWYAQDLGLAVAQRILSWGLMMISYLSQLIPASSKRRSYPQ
jgi:hypothetical protein